MNRFEGFATEENNGNGLEDKVSSHFEVVDGRPTDIFEFPGFSIYVEKPTNNEPQTRVEIRAGEKKYNFLQNLPPEHRFVVGSNPDSPWVHNAAYSTTKKTIYGMPFESKGALLTNGHEKHHAIYHYVTLSETERNKLHAARRKFKDGSYSDVNDQEGKLIFADEKNAWEKAIEEIRNIERELGIVILNNDEELERYTNDRLQTYDWLS
ncbi:MAG: hypothetical protein AAB518_01980 [Patescibacteria group bacterium]